MLIHYNDWGSCPHWLWIPETVQQVWVVVTVRSGGATSPHAVPKPVCKTFYPGFCYVFLMVTTQGVVLVSSRLSLSTSLSSAADLLEPGEVVPSGI